MMNITWSGLGASAKISLTVLSAAVDSILTPGCAARGAVAHAGLQTDDRVAQRKMDLALILLTSLKRRALYNQLSAIGISVDIAAQLRGLHQVVELR